MLKDTSVTFREAPDVFCLVTLQSVRLFEKLKLDVASLFSHWWQFIRFDYYIKCDDEHQDSLHAILNHHCQLPYYITEGCLYDWYPFVW